MRQYILQRSERFPDLPSNADIAANQSLVFVTGHFSFSDVVPLLPNQVEIGCLHCRPGEPLQDVSCNL